MQGKSKAVQYGIIGSIISIVLGIIMYIMGPDLFKNWVLSIVIWIFLIIVVTVIMSLSAGAFKKSNGGYVSFQRAFREAFIPAVIMAVVGLLFNILLMNVIDPGYTEELKVAIEEMVTTQYENAGMSEDAIDKQLAKMEKNDQFSILGQTKSTLFGLILYGVIALIIAAIVKKKNPDLV